MRRDYATFFGIDVRRVLDLADVKYTNQICRKEGKLDVEWALILLQLPN